MEEQWREGRNHRLSRADECAPPCRQALCLKHEKASFLFGRHSGLERRCTTAAIPIKNIAQRFLQIAHLKPRRQRFVGVDLQEVTECGLRTWQPQRDLS